MILRNISNRWIMRQQIICGKPAITTGTLYNKNKSKKEKGTAVLTLINVSVSFLLGGDFYLCPRPSSSWTLLILIHANNKNLKQQTQIYKYTRGIKQRKKRRQYLPTPVDWVPKAPSQAQFLQGEQLERSTFPQDSTRLRISCLQSFSTLLWYEITNAYISAIINDTQKKASQ